MMKPKRVIMGVTVNLGNYENLKVDVEGELSAETADADAREIRDSMVKLLSDFGKRDAETDSRIKSYIKRVFP